MTTRWEDAPDMPEKVYEYFRAPFFDSPPGQGATAAQKKITKGIVDSPDSLITWLMDIGVLSVAQYHRDEVTVSMIKKGARIPGDWGAYLPTPDE